MSNRENGECARVANFLRSLASRVEQGDVEPDEMRRISELSMELRVRGDLADYNSEYTERDLWRFLAVGYYVCTNLWR